MRRSSCHTTLRRTARMTAATESQSESERGTEPLPCNAHLLRGLQGATEATPLHQTRTPAQSAQRVSSTPQYFLRSLGGSQFTGCDCSVASGSSFHILIVLSASPVMRREPDWSKAQA